MLAELSPSAAGAPASPVRRPLHVVINAGSGEHDAQQTQAILEEVFHAAGHAAQLMRLDDPADLAEACDRGAARAADDGGVLVVAGGDGTINMAAAAALRHGCALGVIPQGTFNYLARDHGIPLDAEAAARALVRARPQPVQVGLVNDRVFLVNASLGLYPQVLQDREAFKARLGRRRWVALLSGVATVFRWHRRLRLEIELDG
ncbi:MAG TPA: diacylglycerol kinase family protein, partial [Ramlibacter sp.]